MDLRKANNCTMAIVRIFALFYLFTVSLSSATGTELSAEFVFDALSRRIDFVIGEVETVKSDVAEINSDIKRIENRIEIIGNNVSDLIQHVDDKNNNERTSSVFTEKLKRQSKALQSMLKTEKAILREKVDHFQNLFHELQTDITSGFAALNLPVGNSIERLEQIVNDHTTNTNVSLQSMSLEIQIKMNETETNLAEMRLEIKDNSKDTMNKIHEVGENVTANADSNISSMKNEFNSKLRSEISKVTSKINEIERKQDRRDSDVNSQLSGLKSRISSQESYSSRLSERISAEEERKVAFSARLNKQQSYYGKNERIVFDTVIYSHGGGYDSSTGIFTAPKSGTYLFTFNVQSRSVGIAHAVLMVRGYLTTRAIAGKFPMLTGGNTGVEYLYKGDKAWIETANIENKYYIWPYRTTFNGILID